MTSPARREPASPPEPADPTALLRSGAYLRLLVIAAVLGLPALRHGRFGTATS